MLSGSSDYHITDKSFLLFCNLDRIIFKDNDRLCGFVFFRIRIAGNKAY
jgi:hypothetical protein